MENNPENMPINPVYQDNNQTKPVETMPEPGTPISNNQAPDNYVPSMESDNLGINPAETKPKKKISKKAIITFIVIAAILALFYSFKGLFIVALVNGSPISRLELIDKLEKTGGKSTLDMLITIKLINDEARKKSIKITDSEINDEIKRIENQIKSQGLTLSEALTQQNMTMVDFKKQIFTQLQLEKLLGDKILVTDEELDKYITDNQLKAQDGEDSTAFRDQVRDTLKQQKLSSTASEYIDSLKTAAKINYFVKY
jgi:hypothetical protein